MGEVYYLISSGTLSKSESSLVLRNENENINIPVETIDTLLLFGNITITTPALRLLSEKKIPVFLYSESGWYITSIYPESYLQSGFFITKQAMFNQDKQKRLNLAKKIVEGAAKNMSKVCLRSKIGKLKYSNVSIGNASDINELMGVEGNIHLDYISMLDLKFPEKFKINTRTRRPPTNYTNSMMSYLYSVLYGISAAEIYSTHLHPAISFLHEPSERRSSLSLDVSEIFRPIICDRVILRLINLRMINSSDFITDNGVFLNQNGRRKVLEAMDAKMNETVYVHSLRRKVSYRHLIRLELYKIEKHILEESEYKPFISRT
jgi:CRISPR-associated protein Cas1